MKGRVCSAAVTDGDAVWRCNEPATSELRLELKHGRWVKRVCDDHMEPAYYQARQDHGAYPAVLPLPLPASGHNR